MIEQFKLLAESLRRQYPSSEPHLALLSLGTAVLDVRVGSRVYVFGYYPGLSRLAVCGPDGSKPFNRFEDAESSIRSLLRNQHRQERQPLFGTPDAKSFAERVRAVCGEARELCGWTEQLRRQVAEVHEHSRRLSQGAATSWPCDNRKQAPTHKHSCHGNVPCVENGRFP